jgi:hypothetical protein
MNKGLERCFKVTGEMVDPNSPRYNTTVYDAVNRVHWCHQLGPVPHRTKEEIEAGYWHISKIHAVVKDEEGKTTHAHVSWRGFEKDYDPSNEECRVAVGDIPTPILDNYLMWLLTFY